MIGTNFPPDTCMVLQWLRTALLAGAISAAVATVATAQSSKIRDSAGVRIVETAARGTATITFAIPAVAAFDVGGLKENPEHELGLRYFGFKMIRLADGRRVLSDWYVLRFLDANGKQVASFGREGAGPREFRTISGFCRTRGDTLVVYDPGNARVTVLTGNGAWVRDFPARTNAQLRCFDDGTILVAYERETELSIEHVRLDGKLVRNVGNFGGAPPYTRYYSSRSSIAVTGTRFHIGDPRTSEVRSYDQTGKLVRILRTADVPAKVTAAEADALIAQGSGAVGGGTTNAPRGGPPALGPTPTMWPAYGEVQSDAAGGLWIADVIKTRGSARVWTAFDADGRLLGKFSIPAAKSYDDPSVLAFTADGVLIRRQDADGAPHVTEYRWRKSLPDTPQ